jgi:uncharacterized protein (TIGR02391 family)
MWLSKILPYPDTILELTIEELAFHVLKCIQQKEKEGDLNTLNIHNFIGTLGSEKYSEENKEKERIIKAVVESWCWLEREIMIAPRPENTRLYYITEFGELLLKESGVAKYVSSKILNKDVLDPILARKVYPIFIRGDYDTAVFQAFKEVEIRVRTAASMSPESHGTNLMREAYKQVSGKLSDKNRPKAEQQAMSDLFAGAIGLFKNPSSHRDINWEKPEECAELIYLANHLLRVTEAHHLLNKP